MREILFRAWDGKRYSIGKPEYFDDSVNFRFHHFDIDCEKPILEQFTGLHDATKWEDLTDAERDEWIKAGHTKEDWKGRRIFEGEIVNVNGNIGYIEWDAVHARWGRKIKLTCKDGKRRYVIQGIGVQTKMEIIGNIHDNSKLLS